MTRSVRCAALVAAVATVLGVAVLPQVAHAAPGDTTLVSDGPLWADDAGEGAEDPAVSADGRYVAFTSAYRFGDGPDDVTGRQVYVRDRQTGTVELVSVRPDGQAANYDSYGASISADGRYVAFTSWATDLVTDGPESAYWYSDVYRRDRVTGTTVRVSGAHGGGESDRGAQEPAISADGRYVAFSSAATNLTGPADPNAIWQQGAYRRDLDTGALVRLDVPAQSGWEWSSTSGAPAISGDGRYVAFVSDRYDLDDQWGCGCPAVYRRDVAAGLTTRVSVTADGTAADAEATEPTVSSDGRYVAFHTAAALTADDTNGVADVFVRDLSGATTTRVSVADDGAQLAAGGSAGAVSGDGGAVAFVSASAAGDEGAPDAADVYVRQLGSASTRLVSRRTDAAAANGPSREPALDATGAVVAFTSRATNLAAADTDARDDVFTHEPASGPRTRLAIGEPTSGWAGDGSWVTATLTANGTPLEGASVAFTLRDAAGNPVQEGIGYTDATGLAQAWIQLPYQGGDYALDVAFAGDATYPPATRRTTFVVRTHATTVEYTGATSGISDRQVEVSATLRDADEGYLLEWRNVVFELLADNGAPVASGYADTGPNGHAATNLHVPPMPPGQYTLVTRYDGEPGRDGATVSTPFAVGRHPVELTNAGPAFGYGGETTTVRARLVRGDTGEPLQWHTVRFRVEEEGGHLVSEATGWADADGYAEGPVNLMAPPGTYVLRIVYDGDVSHAAAEVTVPFEVRQHPVGLTYTGERTAYATEQVWMRVLVTDLDRNEPLPYTNVPFTIRRGEEAVWSGTLYAGADGVAEQHVPAGIEGEYTVRLEYAGSPSHAPASLDVPLTVRRHPMRLTATGPDTAYVDGPLSYDVALVDPETGTPGDHAQVDVVLRDSSGTEVTRSRGWLGPDGTAAVNVPTYPAPAGAYELTIAFAGNDRFTPASWRTALTLTLRPVTLEYVGDARGTARHQAYVRALVTAPGEDPPWWRDVRFDLVDAAGATVATTSAQVQPDGYATGWLTLPDRPGSFTLRATYDGGGFFENATDETPFEVVLYPSELTYRGPADVPRGRSVDVGARLVDPGTGDPLPGRELTFTLRNADREVVWANYGTTDADGVATVLLHAEWPAGTYELEVAFDGDATHGASRTGTTFTIRVDATELTYTGATTGVRTEPAALVARLVNTYTGQPLAGRTVHAELRDGATVVAEQALTTGEDGWASGDLALDVPAGDYTLVLRYAGSAAEQPAEVSRAFTVTLRPVGLTYGGVTAGITGHQATLAARLVRGDTGEPLAGRAVTFALGPVSATATTGADGVAEAVVTLPAPGAYDVTASVAAAGAFAGATASAAFTVERVPTALAYEGGTGAVSGEPITFAAVLSRTDSGDALDGRDVTFTVLDGAERIAILTARTDGKAEVDWVADVPAGTYAVEVSYDGDALTAPASVTAAFTVTKRATSLADLSPASGVRGTTVWLSTVVADTRSGAPVVGQDVTFRLGSLTATAVTDADGRAAAQVRLDLVPGTYDLTVTSAADGRRAAATFTRAFAVRWQYSFTDDTGLGTVHLNVATKEFQFAGQTESSAIVHDPSMTVTYGVGGSIVEINYRSAPITLVGTFQLSTGRFNATVTTPRGTYVLKRV